MKPPDMISWATVIIPAVAESPINALTLLVAILALLIAYIAITRR